MSLCIALRHLIRVFPGKKRLDAKPLQYSKHVPASAKRSNIAWEFHQLTLLANSFDKGQLMIVHEYASVLTR